MNEIRLCARCDQPVVLIQKGKEWTTSEARGEYRHERSATGGIPSCGRQFLAEHETYTEGDTEQ